MSDNMNTCGGRSSNRIYGLKRNDMDLGGYSAYVDHARDERRVGHDVIVAEFVESFQ